jgi:hypothetical protein
MTSLTPPKEGNREKLDWRKEWIVSYSNKRNIG